MPILSPASFSLFQSCMRSEEAGNKEKQDDDKENGDIPVHPISSQDFVDRYG